MAFGVPGYQAQGLSPILGIGGSAARSSAPPSPRWRGRDAMSDWPLLRIQSYPIAARTDVSASAGCNLLEGVSFLERCTLSSNKRNQASFAEPNAFNFVLSPGVESGRLPTGVSAPAIVTLFAAGLLGFAQTERRASERRRQRNGEPAWRATYFTGCRFISRKSAKFFAAKPRRLQYSRTQLM
jgi:hypothetical protein